eukprot:TCALIF_01483-PB protein Name:"Protein of unknown function" AED:0.49 eAED:1.00 QI:0/0/0/1/0/0/2/0/75
MNYLLCIALDVFKLFSYCVLTLYPTLFTLCSIRKDDFVIRSKYQLFIITTPSLLLGQKPYPCFFQNHVLDNFWLI